MNEFYSQVEEHRDRLTAYFRRMLGDHHEAEDATQEAILKALKARSRYLESGRLTAWLFSIARNHALNLLKARRFSQLPEGDAPELVDPAPSALERLSNREGIEALWSAVRVLPIREREVVEMRLVEEITFSEIASRTGAPLNTVLGRMHSAKSRLRRRLAPAAEFAIGAN
ncbi:MAG: sigma-70 family RNA polymerase sigma factor [Verrucomicrobiota bacterium]